MHKWRVLSNFKWGFSVHNGMRPHVLQRSERTSSDLIFKLFLYSRQSKYLFSTLTGILSLKTEGLDILKKLPIYV